MKIIVLIILSLISLDVNGQATIATIAGNGSAAHAGDGGYATSASIPDHTCSVAFDKYGNYYFPERDEQKVRKVSASGIISTFAGNGTRGYSGDGGPSTAAALNTPVGIAVDSAGNVYIAEDIGSRIRKVDAVTGIISTYAGNGSISDNGDGGNATNAALGRVQQLAIDRNSNLYFTNLCGRIRKIAASTSIITTIVGDCTVGFTGDGGPSTSAKTNQPFGLTTDKFGSILFADWANTRIRKIDATSGTINTIVGNGTYTYNGEGLPATVAQIAPYDVAVNSMGEIIFADFNNSRIRKLDVSGHVITIAGTGTDGFSGDGGRSDSAMIQKVMFLTVDSCDNVIISDYRNYRIRKITYPTGNAPTINITPITTNSLCYSMPVTFLARILLGGSSPTYQWKVNGVNVGSGGPSFTYTPANGDSVQCVLTSNLYCVINPMDTSNTIHMVVGSLTPPTVSITGPTAAMPGSMVNLTATLTSGSSAYSLQWHNHSTLFNTTTVPNVSYTKAAGNDTITATYVSTGRGCYDSAFSTYKVVADSSLGVTKITANNATKCWPNPITHTLHVEGTTKLHDIQLYNLLGQVVANWSAGEEGSMQATIDIAHLPAGVYLVKADGLYVDRVVKR